MEEKVIIIDGVENKITYPIEPNRTLLEKLYDVCNEVFKDKEHCFYSKEEVKKIKSSGSKIFN